MGGRKRRKSCVRSPLSGARTQARTPAPPLASPGKRVEPEERMRVPTPAKRRKVSQEEGQRGGGSQKGAGQVNTRTRSVLGHTRAVPRILRTVFPASRVCNLLEFTKSLEDFTGVKKRIRAEERKLPSSFRRFLSGVLVVLPVFVNGRSAMVPGDGKEAQLTRDEEASERNCLVDVLLGLSATLSDKEKAESFFATEMTLDEVIERAIPWALKHSQKGGSTHTIARGYSVDDRGVGGALSGFGMGVHCYYPNTTVNMLESEEWEAFLRTVGSEVLFFLITRCLLFQPMDEGSRNTSSYVQLSGYNLGDFIKGRSLLVPLWRRRKILPRSEESTSDTQRQRVAPEELKKSEEASRKRKRRPTQRERKWRAREALLDAMDGLHTQAPDSCPDPLLIGRVEAVRPGETADGKAEAEEEEAEEIPRTRPSLTNDWNGLKLNRYIMFYANPNMTQYGLPRKHILNDVGVPSLNSARRLLHSIYKPLSKSSARVMMGSKLKLVTSAAEVAAGASRMAKPKMQTERPRVKRSLLPLLSILQRAIKRHQAMKYRLVLDGSCPLDADTKRAVTRASVRDTPPSERPTYSELTRCFTPHNKVAQFLRVVLSKIFSPLDQLVGAANINVLYRSISELVSLRRHETLPLLRIMEGIQIKEVPWLRAGVVGSVTSMKLESQKKQLAILLYWIFNDLLIPLLRVHFYCTESGAYHNLVFYFRKSLWKGLANLAVRDLTEKMFQSLPSRQVSAIIDSHPFGVSYVRVLPKASGIRPIVNLGRKMPTMEKGKKKTQSLSINLSLQKVLSIMRYEKERKPSIVGASVLGLDDMYARVLPFVEKWRAAGSPKLYFVSADIRKCFDNIAQDQLFATLQDGLFSEASYTLRRYFKVLSCHGRIVQRFEESASPMSDVEEFEVFVKSRLERGKDRNTCLTDRVYYHTCSKEDVLSLLHEHIFNNLIQHGKTCYRQTRGIAQGSVLSTLLCNIHFGAMENTEFCDLPSNLPSSTARDGDLGLIMRFTDDFFYVTTSRDSAAEFVTRLHNGLPKYGCLANTDKTRVNFSLTLPDGKQAKRCEEHSINWCGLTFHTSTMEILPDYSRYFGTFMSDTITTGATMNPGELFRRKMIQHLKPKCHLLLLDLRINSISTVHESLFRILLFAAVKFHCYCCALPQKPASNPDFFMDTILDVLDHLHYFVAAQVESHASDKDVCSCPVKKAAVMWLGLTAFRAVLRRKHTRYPTLVARIDRRLTGMRHQEHPLADHAVASIEQELTGPAKMLF